MVFVLAQPSWKSATAEAVGAQDLIVLGHSLEKVLMAKPRQATWR